MGTLLSVCKGFQYIGNTFRFRLDKIFGLVDMLQIVCVAVVDNVAAVQIGMLRLELVKEAQMLHFGAGEFAVGGDKSQI